MARCTLYVIYVMMACDALYYRNTKHGQQYLVKWRDLPYDQATWENLTDNSPIRSVHLLVCQSHMLTCYGAFVGEPLML